MRLQSFSANSVGLTAMGIFLLFGAAMGFIAATTLLLPGTIADRLWSINPEAYAKMSPARTVVAPAFFLLAAVLLATAIGWFQHRKWAWIAAVAIIAAEIIGNIVNMFLGQFVKSSAGIAIAMLILLYLLRSSTRAAFRRV